MAKLMKLMVIVMILGLFTIGCENHRGPVGSNDTQVVNLGEMGQIMVPAGSTLESATFYAYAVIASGETVNIHRATDAWEEMTVTWNSFGGAYDPAKFLRPETVGGLVAQAVNTPPDGAVHEVVIRPHG